MKWRLFPKRLALAFLLMGVVLCSVFPANAQSEGGTGPTKYVAFREDDVAPNAAFAQLEAVNQLTIDKNVPVTLGIIPHANPLPVGNQLLTDGEFVAYMRSIASTHLFQFGQHGYTHQDLGPSNSGPSEFYGRPYVAQYQAIKRGRDDIIQAFAVTPTSFLPPFDKSDNNTLKAAQALGFKEYCTAFADFNVNQGYIGGMKLDTISVELGNQNLQSLENATEQWLNDPHNVNTFVVLYHPADFRGPNGSVNTDELKLLSDYIDYLQGTGRVQFTTLDHSWTTTGNATASSSSSRGVPSGTNVISTNRGSGILMGSYLNESLGALFPYAVTLIALACFSVYWVVTRPRSKRRRPRRL